MNLQALSTLFAGTAVLAIGASVLLRDRSRRLYTTFAFFSITIAAHFLLKFVSLVTQSEYFTWGSYFAVAFVPTSSVRFFRAFLAEPSIGGKRRRSAVTYVWTGAWCATLFYGLFFQPIYNQLWFQIPFALFVYGGLYRSVLDLFLQYRATITREERTRIRYLMVGGFVAITLSLSGFLPRFGEGFPTLGHFFAILYMYFLSQSIFRYRLLDLNELVGRMLVLASLVGILTITYGILLSLVSGDANQGPFLLSTIVASFVVLVVVEPARTFLEDAINRWLVRERYELRFRIERLRRELMNVIDVREMVGRVLDALEASKRATNASFYLIDREGAGYDLLGFFGEEPIERLETAAHNSFFDRIRGNAVSRAILDQELQSLTTDKEPDDKRIQTLHTIANTLDETKASLAIPVLETNDDAPQLLAILCLRDERMRDAYIREDVDNFRSIAAQAAITIENSQVYERMKQRDRLAALGEMAAGLAHEIRNPLGAIKGAAQLLVKPNEKLAANSSEVREYLDIIVDEVNRLNKVVSQFLDYARPYKGEQKEVFVNDVLNRTLPLLGEENDLHVEVEQDPNLSPVRGDAELLRQVFLNLGLNGLQAMKGSGTLSISTCERTLRFRGENVTFVDISFRDTGPGIANEHLKNLFIPFFTTKEKGTGLGLPICQRIVAQHGGRIEVRTQRDKGTTFSVLLPTSTSESISITGQMARPAVS